MKKHTRNLLIIIPLLPLLMANSPAPQREEYKDVEAVYQSVESLHGYNFYHFKLINFGEGYVDYIDLNNKPNDTYFYASLQSNEICPPFDSVFIEPGFEKEVIIVSKDDIPESKEVKATAYYYYVKVEDMTFGGSKHVAYSVNSSTVSSNYFVYNIQAYYTGATDSSYNYCAAAYFKYKGEDVCVRLGSIDNLSFTTNKKLDLNELVLEDIAVLRSNVKYNYYDGIYLGDAIQTLLIFLLIFVLVLGFGIFSAIFFPALARKKRRKALLEQENK